MLDKDVYILNALDKDVHTKVFGNHFTFKAGQVKRMRGEIGDFIAKERGYLGLVAVSDKFDDPEYKTTEAGQAELEAKKREGKEKRAQHLQWQVHNLQVSLRQDLDNANIKADTLSFATKGDLDAMDELATLQRAEADEAKARLQRARELERKLKASANALANAKKED